MALLSDLGKYAWTGTKALGGFGKKLIFGENPQDVEITDPQLLAARQYREQLAQRAQDQLSGGQTEGEKAILGAARQGAEEIAAQQRAQAAGARGFGRLAANTAAQQATALGQQKLLGSAATAAGAQRAQDIGRAEQMLGGLADSAAQQYMQEQEIKKGMAKPGLLGLAGTLAGGIYGFKKGGLQGALQGAQAGGALGGGLQQFGQRWL